MLRSLVKRATGKLTEGAPPYDPNDPYAASEFFRKKWEHQGYNQTDIPLMNSDASLSPGRDKLGTIQRVFESVVNNGHLSPARYEITVNCPLTLLTPSKFFGINERLSISCESVSMPGRSVGTQPNRIYGPVREMPYEKIYSGDLDMEFRVGKDMLERVFFENWMDIVAFSNSHHINYMDSYKGTVTIAQLNHQDRKVYEMELFDVYPKAINPISYSYGAVDDTVKQSVSLHFRQYKVLELTETSDIRQ